jgi:putative addiction module component (TIGR02574 family)
MTEHAQSLLHEALSLSADERADLIAELLVSLEDAPVDEMATVEHAWADELETRARRVLSGQVDGEEWTQVRNRVSQALTEG